MARTIKKQPPNPYRKENKESRKQHRRKLRAQERKHMASGSYDAIDREVGTCGWLTW